MPQDYALGASAKAIMFLQILFGKIEIKQDIDECENWRAASASEGTEDIICLKIAQLINS
jgi:hypothetical protein